MVSKDNGKKVSDNNIGSLSTSSKNIVGHVIPGITKLYIKIPVERIGIVIGKDGETLKKIMEATKTLITVNEIDGVIVIEPASPYTKPIDLMKAQDIIKAIGYGFSPDKAFRLIDEDQILVVIDLKDYIKPSLNHLTRVKGRIIGEEGKVRKNIENMTDTYISIYDDYISIIGDYDGVNIAREAIMMLIEGRQHTTVYRYIDKAMRQVKRSRMTSIWRTEY
jgi:ribosomal RNA assembly protein